MKLSAIIVSLAAPLRFMPPQDLEAVSRFLFQWVQGADRIHQSRWRRMWSRAFHSRQPHPTFSLFEAQQRSGEFHARHMAIEGRIFEAQEEFITRAAFRIWLKTGAAFGHYEPTPAGRLLFVPSSLSYEECSDDEMREFHEDAMAFLRTPHALATLWPHASDAARAAGLAALIQDPNQQPGDAP